MSNLVEMPTRLTSKIVGVWMWHVQKDVIQADPAVCDYFAVPPRDGEIGVPLAVFLEGIHDDDRPRVVSRISRAVMTGKPFHEVYRVVDGSGEVRSIEAKGVCFRDAEGRPATYPGTIVDVPGDIREHPHIQVVEHLMEACQFAEVAKEPVLTKLIEAVLLEAGMRLASNMDARLGDGGGR